MKKITVQTLYEEKKKEFNLEILVGEEFMSKRYPGMKFVDYSIFGNTNGPKQGELIAGLPYLLRKHECDAIISGVGG